MGGNFLTVLEEGGIESEGKFDEATGACKLPMCPAATGA